MRTNSYIIPVGALLAGLLFASCSNKVEDAMSRIEAFGVFAPPSAESAKTVDELKLHQQLYLDGKEGLNDYPYLPVIIQLAKECGKDIPIAILTDLLEGGVDVNAKDKSGMTALEQAMSAESPSEPLVDFLLQRGADPNQGSHSVLFDAVHMGDTEQSVRFLGKFIAAGATVNPDKPGEITTPLMAALYGNKPLEIIQFLIDKGADVNYATSAKETPLMAAESSGCGSEVRTLLIRSKANVNAVDNYGRNAAFYAMQQAGGDALQAYLDAGIDVSHADNDGNTLETFLRNSLSQMGRDALAAAQDPHVNKLRHLAFERAVLKGASDKSKVFDDVVMSYIKADSFQVVSEAAQTAGDNFMKHYLAFQRGEESLNDYPFMANLLCLCVARKQTALPEEIQPFLDAGAPVDMAYEKHSALCYAVEGNNEKVTRMLVDHGANVHGVPDDGNVEHPLWLAAYNANESIAKCLVAKGANPNALVNNDPLVVLAYKRDMVDAARILLAVGANPNMVFNTPDPFSIVVYFAGEKNLTKYLPDILKYGGDPNSEHKSDNEAFPALVVASMLGNLDAVKILVEHGADIDGLTSVSKSTALMYALATDNAQIATYLVRAGASQTIRNKYGKTAKDIAAEKGAREVINALINSAANSSSATPEDRAAAEAVRQLLNQ